MKPNRFLALVPLVLLALAARTQATDRYVYCASCGPLSKDSFGYHVTRWNRWGEWGESPPAAQIRALPQPPADAVDKPPSAPKDELIPPPREVEPKDPGMAEPMPPVRKASWNAPAMSSPASGPAMAPRIIMRPSQGYPTIPARPPAPAAGYPAPSRQAYPAGNPVWMGSSPARPADRVIPMLKSPTPGSVSGHFGSGY